MSRFSSSHQFNMVQTIHNPYSRKRALPNIMSSDEHANRSHGRNSGENDGRRGVAAAMIRTASAAATTAIRTAAFAAIRTGTAASAAPAPAGILQQAQPQAVAQSDAGWGGARKNAGRKAKNVSNTTKPRGQLGVAALWFPKRKTTHCSNITLSITDTHDDAKMEVQLPADAAVHLSGTNQDTALSRPSLADPGPAAPSGNPNKNETRARLVEEERAINAGREEQAIYDGLMGLAAEAKSNFDRHNFASMFQLGNLQGHEDDISDNDGDWDDDSGFDLEGVANEDDLPVHIQKILRLRQKYTPGTSSTLGQYLHKVKHSMKSRSAEVCRGMTYIPPPADPLSQVSLDPADWYRSQYWVYVFLPFQQFTARCGNLSEFCCIHCGKKGGLLSKGQYFRPMFDHAKITWLLHRRVQCKCRKTFAEIDPRFLNQLPTEIVDRFPFMTTSSGFGMHRMIMYQFLSFATKGIFVGAFTDSYNEILRLQHSYQHVSFLDTLHDRKKQSVQQAATTMPQTFHAFSSPGEFNGILLPKGLVRTLFFRMMRVMDPYMQKSFQTVVDEGASSDHTFKYGDSIYDFQRSGKIYTASWTMMTLNGKVALSRLVYTKGNDEIRSVCQEHKQVRLTAGVPKLKRFESDGGGDRALVVECFPELAEGTVPFRAKKVDGLPCARIADSDIVYLSTYGKVNDWAGAVLNTILKEYASDDEILVGLDTEWNTDETYDLTRTLQIAFDSKLSSKVAVIHLSRINAFTSETFPNQLRILLEDSRIIATGVNVAGDVRRLNRLGVCVTRMCDLKQLGLQLDSNIVGGFGLKSLCARFLLLGVDKSNQAHENWAQIPLPASLLQYAALDAKLSLALAQTMLKKAQSKLSQTVPANSCHAAVQPGATVNIVLHQKICACATVVFMGGIDGAQQMWGNLCIGKGKSLVKIDHLLLASSKPPYYYQPVSGDDQGGAWDRTRATLGSVFSDARDISKDCIIAVPTDSLVPQIPKAGMKQPPVPRFVNTVDVFDAASAVNGCVGTARSTDEAAEIGFDGDDYDDDSSNDEPMRSRDKKDIFHVVHSLPISKKSPLRAAVRRLLVHATFEFDKDDFDSVFEYLLQAKKVASVEQALEHFHFNKEWWRRRVKMPVRPANKHAAAVSIVHKLVKESMNEIYDDALKSFLDRLELEAQHGKFEEVDDVEIFKCVGRDSNGLDLYLRNRGSRAENLHQKMKSVFGNYCVGAQAGHYLLVLTSYRYNINVGIARRDEQDFGHPWHFLVDRIQIRTQQIYGFNLYPQHKNVQLAPSVPGHVAVGIGPLCYDPDYVDTGECHQNLRGDMRFLAEKMNLVLPPLPLSHRDEHKIFNDYVKAHPSMKAADFRALARDFKSRSDGLTIFPKLPSILKAHYNQWKENRLIDGAESKIKAKLNTVLGELAVPSTSASRARTAAMPANELGLLCNDAKLHVEESQNPLPVPPPAAPGQLAFVATVSNQQRKPKRCVYFPFCPKDAYDCGGWQLGLTCSQLGSSIPPIESLQLAKREHRNEQKRIRAAEKRASVKRQRIDDSGTHCKNL